MKEYSCPRCNKKMRNSSKYVHNKRKNCKHTKDL